MQSNSSRMQSNSNQIAIESNRKAIEHSLNQSQKTLENSINSMIVRLIRSIEKQSNDYIRLNSIDLEKIRLIRWLIERRLRSIDYPWF